MQKFLGQFILACSYIKREVHWDSYFILLEYIHTKYFICFIFIFSQAYCNIVAGACFALGLKYAGSADETAFQTLLHFCHRFTSLTSKSVSDLAGKPTIETCLNVVLTSSAMVCKYIEK